ncbi:hypothetical protein FB45DRAFT_901010 [Roridomyces roridus]|uniref:F-box domain-containing protein n=1 Tax=Roridomyces roridus TaxID=1738132 RepID=A0AAD7C889_9AGAR|nr:hypothetical protein FB45DRAFT_901010 [Roridomyces roridus]
MPDLPLELLGLIADETRDDTETLFALRLVSKAFKQIATSLAFRVIAVEDRVESAQAVLSLMQNYDEAITTSVRELVFLGVSGDFGSNDNSENEGIDALIALFSALIKFPNLACLRFHFYEVYAEDCHHGDMPREPSHFLRLQLGIFDALATSPLPSTVKTLVLKNIIPVWAEHDIYHREDFRAIFRSLETLEISDIPSEYEARCEPGYRHFWEANVAAMIRSATSLVSLTIRCAIGPVGVYPTLPFGDILLPHLSKLLLQDFTLEPLVPRCDVLEFIVRHQDTLTHLELHDCSIGSQEPTGSNSAPRQHERPWYAIFERFAAELGQLNNFVFKCPDPEWSSGEFPYTALYPTGGMYVFEQDVGDRDRDRAALESLQALVKSRSECL